MGLSDKEKEAVGQFEGGKCDKIEVDVEVEFVLAVKLGAVVTKTEVVKAETYVWNYKSAHEIVPVEEWEWTIIPLVRETESIEE